MNTGGAVTLGEIADRLPMPGCLLWDRSVSELTQSSANPMHRYGSPEEVAQLVAFLLSDESSYITGAEIAIDDASSA